MTVEQLSSVNDQSNELAVEIDGIVAAFATRAGEFAQRTAPDIARDAAINNEIRVRELGSELSNVKRTVQDAVDRIPELAKEILDDPVWPHRTGTTKVSRPAVQAQMMTMVRRLYREVGRALIDAKIAPARNETPPKWGLDSDGHAVTFDGTLADPSEFEETISSYLEAMDRYANIEKQLTALRRRAARDEVARMWDDA